MIGVYRQYEEKYRIWNECDDGKSFQCFTFDINYSNNIDDLKDNDEIEYLSNSKNGINLLRILANNVEIAI